MVKKKRKTLIKKTIFIFIILVILTLIIISYDSLTSRGKLVDAKYKKVLVIGLDGMDPELTSRMMSEGKLPNFQRIMETGSFIKLNTSNPPSSPVAWTSIATGSNPGKHNIFDFIIRNPKDYIPKLSISETKSGIGKTDYFSNIKATPFWKITSDKKIPTTIIRWPAAFPPQKVNGKFLSGLGVPDIKGFLSGYALYTTEKGTNEELASKKIINVEIKKDTINTLLYGPKTRRGTEIIDITAPLQIKMNNDNNSINLAVDNQVYLVKLHNWSSWIRVKFKTGLGQSAYGIFKANLISLKPFKLFITTIQIDPENPIIDISYPSSYSKELAKDVGLYYTLGMPEETTPLNDGKISQEVFLEQVADIEAQRNRMFMKEFKNFQEQQSGLLAFVFDSSDHIQHILWDKNLSKTDKAVENYWIEKDKLLGQIVETIDNHTLLLIISDHGFSYFERAVNLNTWLVDNSFMTLKQNIKEGEDASLFKNIDWSKTTAYALGFNSIYINLKGREAQGIVESKDKEKIIQEIINKLEKFKDNKTGKTIINKAYKASEIYSGKYVNNGPDIIVGYNPGYRASWETAVGGLTGQVIYDNDREWKGDHLIDSMFVPGVLFSNVKLNTENRESASQIDIAPTILDALGISVPKEMDGKNLLK